jgi:hypothetical protein
MAIMSSRLIRHEVCVDDLKKIGAKVIDIQGIMFHVSFNIKEHKISYIYHLNEDNSYLLERVSPYFVQIGNYDKEENIVNAIKIDIEQFRNAVRSSNFKNFIKVDTHISQLVRIFEDLYLYYNIENEQIELLDKDINKLLESIKEMMRTSTRVYYKKDPDILKTDVRFEDK